MITVGQRQRRDMEGEEDGRGVHAAQGHARGELCVGGHARADGLMRARCTKTTELAAPEEAGYACPDPGPRDARRGLAPASSTRVHVRRGEDGIRAVSEDLYEHWVSSFSAERGR